jgi:hypothetical protein
MWRALNKNVTGGNRQWVLLIASINPAELRGRRPEVFPDDAENSFRVGCRAAREDIQCDAAPLRPRVYGDMTLG